MSLKKVFTMKFKQLVGLLLLTVYSATTLACDLHGSGGFGFGMYGPQKHNWEVSPVDTSPKIKLKFPFVTKISTAELSDIDIAYELPIDVKDARIDIKSSTHLEVKSENSLTLQKEGGAHSIQVETEAKGQHVLTLQVSAMQNNKPISMTRRIFISAQHPKQG